ncbi:NLI-interacting factor [Strigomonas culicis]|uniref:Mitochondrial import inner membrane translocase subunit TIM50 n=1 Tax=Strigomonas culicis TaxID=28005 RepID=S9V4V0_9TRYP|nr:NLI-interacting factor [Strigomonas culicis]|eukprot:EPY36064.1 NLI-interacting factor [Strigomonas culicis]
MFRRHAKLLSTAAGAATATTPQQLTAQVLVGIGLARGFTPHWPVPLPPPVPTPSVSAERSAPLPKEARAKPVLVLDIDETLIHTYHVVSQPQQSDQAGPPRADDLGSTSELFQTPSQRQQHPEVPLINVRMVVRPHLKEFLTEVMQLFEVVFWTAGTSNYAAAVLDAIERHVLGLPRSLYHFEEVTKLVFFSRKLHALQEAKRHNPFASDAAANAAREHGDSGTSHVNFYCLSRTQTLESLHYMKYIPLLGRPLHRTVMIDDNERSFPLTPRNGIKVPFFEVNGRLIDGTSRGRWVPPSDGGAVPAPQWPDLYKEGLYTFTDIDPSVVKDMQDTALLDLLPLLRALAATPEDDITRELDHWREPDYALCDNFRDTMDPRSARRRYHLGVVLPTRQPRPIPPYKAEMLNAGFEEQAKAEMNVLQGKGLPRPRL